MIDTFKPFVSIIIPTYNVESTIEDVIRSIMNLDYPKDRFEIIIVDAYSKDRTVEKISKYPINIYQKDCNPPEAYNFIINKAKGDIIALADGDAIVDRKWLDVLVPLLKEPDIAGAGGLCLTWNKEKIVPRTIGYELQYRYENMPPNISRIATMNVIYKKNIIKKVGGFNEKLSTAYDTDIGHKIRNIGYKILFEPAAKVYHYHRPTLMSYYIQQYVYGKNVPTLYIDNMKIAKGDEVTSLWMNAQPFIYSIILIFMLSIPLIGNIGVILTLLLFGSLSCKYLFESIKISVRYNDFSAMFLIILFFVRGVAWTHGGIIALFQLLANGRLYRILNRI